MTPSVLSIGLTDSWNAAGVGLDQRALAACGTRALTIVAGVTAQDRHGVHRQAAIAPDLIAAQLASIEAADPAAVRIGALLDASSVVTIATWLRSRTGRRMPVIYDPVLGASAGGAFGDAATIGAIVSELFPLVTLATPNLHEAARLAGVPVPDSPAEMETTGSVLLAAGLSAALVTGGHLAHDPVDVLVRRDGMRHFRGERLPGTPRGTGCLLACGIAAAFAREPTSTLEAAVEAGRTFVRACFARALDVGGMRVAF